MGGVMLELATPALEGLVIVLSIIEIVVPKGFQMVGGHTL